MSSDDQGAKAPQDVVFVHSKAEDGEGYRVIRARPDSIQLGELRSVKEGEPIKGELVRLKPRQEHRLLFDVQTILSIEDVRPVRPHGRPAQVASESYRRNWDEIFGVGRPGKPELPN
jgi:hypothetical protein